MVCKNKSGYVTQLNCKNQKGDIAIKLVNRWQAQSLNLLTVPRCAPRAHPWVGHKAESGGAQQKVFFGAHF